MTIPSSSGNISTNNNGAVIDYSQSKQYIKPNKMQEYKNVVGDILLIILKVLDKSLAI